MSLADAAIWNWPWLFVWVAFALPFIRTVTPSRGRLSGFPVTVPLTGNVWAWEERENEISSSHVNSGACLSGVSPVSNFFITVKFSDSMFSNCKYKPYLVYGLIFFTGVFVWVIENADMVTERL